MSGVINCAASNELYFQEIKDLSKKLGYTINDVIFCAVSSAIKKLFREQKDESAEV